MRHPSTSLAAAALAVMAAPPAVATPPAPPPPAGAAPEYVEWQAGAATCGSSAITPEAWVAPLPARSWPGSRPGERTARFRIDASGRALSIGFDPAPGTSPPDDLGPALAASRFPAGSPRADCTITYKPVAKMLGEASPDTLARYLVAITAPPMQARMFLPLLYPKGSDCLMAPRPMPRVMTFPDLARITKIPGQPSWSFAAFDIQADGSIGEARIAAGSGNAELDREMLQALSQSRFAEGTPRHACIMPGGVPPASLAAPILPDALRKPARDARCPEKPEWDRKPVLVFPANWNRRGIEGWAVVSFDSAPWGETGNVRAIASEPSDEFGMAAIRIVKAAQLKASSTGETGCVQVVRFRIAGNGTPPNLTD